MRRNTNDALARVWTHALMDRLYPPLAVCLCAASATAQVSLDWVQQFGTPDIDSAGGIAPEPGGTLFAPWWNGAGEQAELARFDQNGGAVPLGGVPGVPIRPVMPDGSGGYFLGGSTAAGAWIARCTDSGEILWSDVYGDPGPGGYHRPVRLVADGSGGAFLVTYWILPGQESDFRVSRYTASGERLWLKTYGKPGPPVAGIEEVHGAAPDGAGGLFVCGLAYSDYFEPNPEQELMQFVARIDGSGELAWGRHLSDGTARALCPDGDGGCFVAGQTSGGPLGWQVYLARVTAEGELLWDKSYGTAAYDAAMEVELLPGGFVVGGRTKGDLGAPNAGNFDLFVSGHDFEGDQHWLYQFGSAGWDEPRGLGVGPGGAHVFLSGFTRGDLAGPLNGFQDAFIARFSLARPCYPDFDADGDLDLFDFLAFFNAFNAGQDAADCDGGGSLNLFDFLCFVSAFNAGC